ncbi:MAG: hypothetical protein HQK53_01895 [Oligoflexia bacterium]|nr:hypothetical protein [Oligoflexia bacterium]
MSETLDKLILRTIIALTLCLLLLIYKYTHFSLKVSLRPKLTKKFYPSQNPADTLYFFSRILGVAIILTAPFFDIEYGPFNAFLGFMLQALIAITFYIISIYIMESITLFHFEYQDEVVTRKNICYSIICFAEATAIALVIKSLITYSNFSFFLLLYYWLLAIVLLGLSSKLYYFRSNMEFNKLMIHKNLALGLSYSGHLLGAAIIIISSFNQPSASIEDFTFTVLLKIILAIILLPIIQQGIIIVFKIKNEIAEDASAISNNESITKEVTDLTELIDLTGKEHYGPTFSQGIYEGVLFFTSSFLTSTVTGPLNFGNFYPLLQ